MRATQKQLAAERSGHAPDSGDEDLRFTQDKLIEYINSLRHSQPDNSTPLGAVINLPRAAEPIKMFVQ